MAPEISPYLYYEDGAAAMDWLIQAFGFEEDMRMTSDEGRLEHGQVKLGDQIVMLGEPGSDYQSPKKRGGAEGTSWHPLCARRPHHRDGQHGGHQPLPTGQEAAECCRRDG